MLSRKAFARCKMGVRNNGFRNLCTLSILVYLAWNFYGNSLPVTSSLTTGLNTIHDSTAYVAVGEGSDKGTHSHHVEQAKSWQEASNAS